MFERRRVALEHQDVPTLMADYADDCIVESPSAGTHTGKQAIQEALNAIFDALDIQVRQQSILIDGDSVAASVQMEGKDVGTFLGLPPTGKSFRAPAVLLYDLKDGRIVRERRVYDFTGLMVQIGLLKAKLTV
jgi:steroid delta-isomerase-like uncharacterized protein